MEIRFVADGADLAVAEEAAQGDGTESSFKKAAIIVLLAEELLAVTTAIEPQLVLERLLISILTPKAKRKAA